MSNSNRTFRRSARFFAALTLSGLVVGCAEMAPEQRELVVASVTRTCHDHMVLTGRFSAQYRKDGREEAVHGNFELVQTGTTTNVTLRSP